MIVADKIFIDFQYKFKYDVYCFCCRRYKTVDAETAYKIIESSDILYIENTNILSTLHEKEGTFWVYQIPCNSCIRCSNEYIPKEYVGLCLLKADNTQNSMLTKVYD